MTAPRAFLGWSALAACVALAGAVSIDRLAPFPAADASRGGEEAFFSGVHDRELSRAGPLRWTHARAVAVFERLPPGAVRIDVALASVPTPLSVVVNGAVLARLGGAARSAQVQIPDPRGRVEVVLLGEGRRQGGRHLGALLGRVRVEHGPAGVPRLSLVWLFLLPALCAVVLGHLAGLAPPAAAGAAAALTCVQGAALLPGGLVRSPYAPALALFLAGGCAAAALFARVLSRRAPERAPWAFVALLAALFVQGVAATTPAMVVSDAVFHANKLDLVAGGEWFPTSGTQHARPFRFPYGVAFYALLLPFEWAGLASVDVVRWGAGLSGMAGSAALFVLLCPLSARRAALAVGLLQILPGTFEVYSYGNLSNVFAQGVTAAFLAWWVRRRGGKTVGVALLFLGCTAHLSGLAVLVTLAAALLVVPGRAAWHDRDGLAVLVIGFGLAAAYYAHFVGLAVEQVARLGEGSGPSGGLSLGRALWEQVTWARLRWGLPAVVLALAGLPRARRQPVEMALTAFWLAGGLLLLVALVTPVEVRYQYALTLPVAAAAAGGAARLWQRRPAGRPLVLLGVGLQVWLATEALIEAVLWRYRS